MAKFVRKDENDGIIGQAKAKRPNNFLGFEADAGKSGGGYPGVPGSGGTPPKKVAEGTPAEGPEP